MVTASTHRKEPFFHSTERLEMLCDTLLKLAGSYEWKLQAWAVFSNHYHFIALAPPKVQSLRSFIRHLHSVTAIEVNRMDNVSGRKVWFQYWDSHLTYEKSYYARLNYVHRNAVHHGLVRDPSAYRWCSAAWFEGRAPKAFYQIVSRFPCDQLKVPDDYAVVMPAGGASSA